MQGEDRDGDGGKGRRALAGAVHGVEAHPRAACDAFRGVVSLGIEPQWRALCEPVEVGIGVQDGRASAYAGCGDETVQRLADRHTRASGTTVQLSCQREVIQTVETQHWKCPQVTFDEACFSVRAETLEDLGEHDVGERNRLSTLDQFDAAQRLW